MNHYIIDSVDAYNKLYGLTTYHPLVAAVDLKEAKNPVPNGLYDYRNMYALFLKKGTQCVVKYGRQIYDYQEGSVVSFSPGQKVEVVGDNVEFQPDVLGVLFHADIMFGTPLADKIRKYSFFDYSQMEALHLSEQEKALFIDCYNKLRDEVERPIDRHSADLLSANIQLMLEYIFRFYDRQFITRHKANSGVVAEFERALQDYFSDGENRGGLPTVAHFADKACLSAGYFGDLIKKETGVTAQELISKHIVNVAKQLLATGTDDISLIAYDLGFQYPQHFTRLFKRVTGLSPSAYRQTLRN
ncbi:MAG: helix-turn-helix domain-containing protein [Paramuribaculum sp.]|nr:helix-turn-helix domain-containing protein [Paramuribaculum sp.]